MTADLLTTGTTQTAVGPRGRVRRVLLWLGVALFFASALFTAIVGGDPTALVGFGGFSVVGAVILGSRPGNGVGWLLYSIGILWTITGPLASHAVIHSLPTWVEAASYATGWITWPIVPLIGLVFPTGRVQTRLGRVLLWAIIGFSAAAAVVAYLTPRQLLGTGRESEVGVPGVEVAASIVVGAPGIAYLGLVVLGVIIDVALRWRRSFGPTRLQFQWLGAGLTAAVLGTIAGGVANAVAPGAGWVSLVSLTAGLSLNLIPISIGVAVTRHGLYDIGRVVSRTVSYVVVTALAIGVYALGVTSFTWLLPELPAVGVAVATLAAAAAFLPLLRGLQRRIDRRFDRERYDAQRIVDEFGQRLRTQSELEDSGADLTRAVETALQPGTIGLWINGAAR